MPKTIQVRDETYRALERLKRKMKVKTFDEVIERLILKELDLPSDMFGVDRGIISPFTEKDRIEDREW